MLFSVVAAQFYVPTNRAQCSSCSSSLHHQHQTQGLMYGRNAANVGWRGRWVGGWMDGRWMEG